MASLPMQVFDAAQNRLRRVPSRTLRIIQLVGDEIAHILQQDHAPLRDNQLIQTKRAFKRFKPLLPAHLAVTRYALFALRVPNAHRRHIVSRQTALHGKPFGKTALSARRAADYQRQHCGLYGSMPPSANE